MPEDTAVVDGRAARSARTREAVANAFLDLLEEGVLRPTARQVAQRAGVSLRSVFQHFDDLETLLAEVADRQIERLQPLWHTPRHGGPFAERLAKFVSERSRILEAISPVRKAALLQEPFSDVVARRLNWVREAARADVAVTFAPELAGRAQADREELLAALDVASNWATWEALRRQHMMSPDAAARTMSRMIEALLKERPSWNI